MDGEHREIKSWRLCPLVPFGYVRFTSSRFTNPTAAGVRKKGVRSIACAGRRGARAPRGLLTYESRVKLVR
jgi:hypothetical protein